MLRNEIKYYINNLQAAELGLFLKSSMCTDPHSDKDGCYWVRSLYFDTPGNRDYYDKIIGHGIRKKIRMRIYDISTRTVKLELKSRYGNSTNKDAVLISREDACRIIFGDCKPLLEYGSDTACKIFAFMNGNLYHPTVLIDYIREAYSYPFLNIRITIDRNLCAKSYQGSYDLFEDGLYLAPLLDNCISILEIKFDRIIPGFLQRMLSGIEAQRTQISKYCIARSILSK